MDREGSRSLLPLTFILEQFGKEHIFLEPLTQIWMHRFFATLPSSNVGIRIICYQCFCIHDWKIFLNSHCTKFVHFYLFVCRFPGVLVMLLPLFSLQWWRCQLIPSSYHSARTLRSTKGQPNMRLPFSLKLLMTKMRCRDSLKDPSKRSQCLIFLLNIQNPYVL